MGGRQQRNPVSEFKTQGITFWPGNGDIGGTYRRNLNQGRWNLPEEMQAVKRSTQLQCFYATGHRRGPKDCCIVTQFLFIPLLIYLFIHIFIWPPKHAMWGSPDFFLHGVLKKPYGPWPGLGLCFILGPDLAMLIAFQLGDQWLTKPQSRGRFVVRGLVTEQLPILHLWDVFWLRTCPSTITWVKLSLCLTFISCIDEEVRM